MIEVKHLTIGYGAEPVLKDVSVTFPEGAVTVLAGPNGSGKSTLLKAALKLLDGGEKNVFYDGVPAQRLSRRQVARQAALLVQSRTPPSIEAERLVLHGRFPYLSYPRQYSAQDQLVASQAMARTGADQYAHRLVSELSGGQRQSVYLAMLLAQQTKTVFLDEPTTFLDIRRQLELMGWVRSLASEGHAVVLVLHDLPLAMQTADKLVLLADGAVAAQGTPEEIYASGVLESVFGIRFRRFSGEDGVHYYCSLEEGNA